MPKLHFILKDSSVRTLDVAPEGSVMTAALLNNVSGVEAECGGCCSCGTCHVYVEAEFIAQLPAPDEAENELLDFVNAPREAGSRLACQLDLAAIPDGLRVRVPLAQHEA
jgi:ferredoxin, 2Fe-2S